MKGEGVRVFNIARLCEYEGNRRPAGRQECLPHVATGMSAYVAGGRICGGDFGTRWGRVPLLLVEIRDRKRAWCANIFQRILEPAQNRLGKGDSPRFASRTPQKGHSPRPIHRQSIPGTGGWRKKGPVGKRDLRRITTERDGYTERFPENRLRRGDRHILLTDHRGGPRGYPARRKMSQSPAVLVSAERGTVPFYSQGIAKGDSPRSRAAVAGWAGEQQPA